MQTKQCFECRKEKEISEFHKNLKRKDGLNIRCDDCHNEYNRKWYYDNHSKARQQNFERIEKYKQFVRDQKQKPCLDCQKQYPHYVMDFDHRER